MFLVVEGLGLLVLIVHLSFMNRAGAWNTATLPGLQDATLQQLLETTDKTCALDQEEFFTSFQLSDTNILSEISRPEQAEPIRAKLWKLNVCTALTKAHVQGARGGAGTVRSCSFSLVSYAHS